MFEDLHFYDMGDYIKIGVDEGGRVCDGGRLSAGGFCVESFSPSKMRYRLQNSEYKLPIMALMELLRKGKISQHVQSSFHSYF